MCDDWNGNRGAPRRSHERRDFSAKAGSPSVAREADKHGDASHPAQAEMGVAGITGVVRRGEGSIYDANPETLCYSLVPPVPGGCAAVFPDLVFVFCELALVFGKPLSIGCL